MIANQTLAESIREATTRRNARVAKEAKVRRKKLLAKISSDTFTFKDIFAVAGVTKDCLSNMLTKMIQHKELTAIKDEKPWIYVKVPGAFDVKQGQPKEKHNA